MNQDVGGLRCLASLIAEVDSRLPLSYDDVEEIVDKYRQLEIELRGGGPVAEVLATGLVNPVYVRAVERTAVWRGNDTAIPIALF